MDKAKQLILASVAELEADHPWGRWVKLGAVRDTTVLEHDLFDAVICELADEARVVVIPNPARWRITPGDEYTAVTWQGRRVHLVRLAEPGQSSA